MATAVNFSTIVAAQVAYVNHDAVLNPGSGDFTWVFHGRWASGATLVNYGYVFEKATSYYLKPSFECWQRNFTIPTRTALEVRLRDAASGEIASNGSDAADIRDDLWHQWAVTYDASEGDIAILRDGAGYDSVNGSPIGEVSPVTNSPLSIGGRWMGTYSNNGSDSKICHFWCVARIVGAAELALYRNILAAPSDAVLWLPMSEGTGTTCNDKRPPANNAGFAAGNASPTWDTSAGHSLFYPGGGVIGAAVIGSPIVRKAA